MTNGYKEDIFTQGAAYVSVMLTVFLPVYRDPRPQPCSQVNGRQAQRFPW